MPRERIDLKAHGPVLVAYLVLALSGGAGSEVRVTYAEALRDAYEEVSSLNRAKDKVINHLSHELKTPLSVLSASLTLPEKRFPDMDETDFHRIMGRSRRNLRRLLDMQYEIGDMLREQDYRIPAGSGKGKESVRER